MSMFCKGELLKYTKFEGRDGRSFVRVIMMLADSEPLTVMFEEDKFDIKTVEGQEGKQITLKLGNPKKPVMWA